MQDPDKKRPRAKGPGALTTRAITGTVINRQPASYDSKFRQSAVR